MGALKQILDLEEGGGGGLGAPKICILQNQQKGEEGAVLKHWTAREGGC